MDQFASRRLVALGVLIAAAAIGGARARADEPPLLVVDAAGSQGHVYDLEFSPDGRTLAAAAGATVRVWEVDSGRLLATLRGDTDRSLNSFIPALAFTPDGGRITAAAYDASHQNWALRVYRLDDPGRIDRLAPAHTARVMALAFAPDGRTYAVAGGDGTVKLWDWSSGQPRGEVRLRGEASLDYLGFPDPLPLLLVFGPYDRGVVALAQPETVVRPPLEAGIDRLDEVLQTAAHRLLGRAATPMQPALDPQTVTIDVRGSSWLRAGKLADRDEYRVELWDGAAAAPELRQVFKGLSYIPKAVALSPDLQHVAVADEYGTVAVWEVARDNPSLILKPAGSPVYALEFAADRDRDRPELRFGNTPDLAHWAFNRYANLGRSFALHRRGLGTIDPPTPAAAAELKTARGAVGLARDGLTLQQTRPDGAAERLYAIPAGRTFWSLALLSGGGLGSDPLVGFGTDYGAGALDLDRRCVVRTFDGHTGAVTSLAQSPDGHTLATGSLDGTIRLWSLRDPKPLADLGCEFDEDGWVSHVVPEGPAARAGVSLGDQVLHVDNRTPADYTALYYSGRWPYKPGQRVRVELERGKPPRPLALEVELTAQGDLAEPLLSLYATDDGEWVVWTPQGYYDASPRGHGLIGWHVNQGPDRAARFLPAGDLQKRFHRPDVIDAVLETGDFATAYARAEASRSRDRDRPPTPAVDPRRQPAVLRRPVRVELRQPQAGAKLASRRVLVSAQVGVDPGRPAPVAEIFRDGARLLGDVHATASDAGAYDVAQEVELDPGASPHRLQVVARSGDEQAMSDVVSVTIDAPPPPVPPAVPERTLRVVTLGVAGRPRPFAKTDAAAFAAAWKDVNIAPLYTRRELVAVTDPSPAAVRKKLQELAAQATRHDTTVVFLTGLSHVVEGKPATLPSAAPEPPGEPLSTADLDAFVRSLLGRLFLFLDVDFNAEPGRDDPLYELLRLPSVVTILAWTRGGDAADPAETTEPEPRGAFVRAFLDVWRDRASLDRNHDGRVDEVDLGQALASRLRASTGGRRSLPPVARSGPVKYDLIPAR